MPALPPLFVWAGKADDDCAAMAQGRAEAREAAAGEHRRLLYVAMTRAAQRLIVAGYEGARARPADCWAHLIAAGLEPHLAQVPCWWDAAQTMGRLGEAPKGDAAPALGRRRRRAAAARLGERARAARGRLPARRAVAPGRGREDARAARAHRGGPACAPADAEPAGSAAGAPPRRGGRLPRPPRRGVAAERRAGLVERALALIEAPELAPLFAPGSRAEVPIVATLARAGGEAAISGRIDRLAATAQEVWIADYKTGAAVVRQRIRASIGALPRGRGVDVSGRGVRAFLLWIDVRRI